MRNGCYLTFDLMFVELVIVSNSGFLDLKYMNAFHTMLRRIFLFILRSSFHGGVKLPATMELIDDVGVYVSSMFHPLRRAFYLCNHWAASQAVAGKTC